MDLQSDRYNTAVRLGRTLGHVEEILRVAEAGLATAAQVDRRLLAVRTAAQVALATIVQRAADILTEDAAITREMKAEFDARDEEWRLAGGL